IFERAFGPEDLLDPLDGRSSQEANGLQAADEIRDEFLHSTSSLPRHGGTRSMALAPERASRYLPMAHDVRPSISALPRSDFTRISGPAHPAKARPGPPSPRP